MTGDGLWGILSVQFPFSSIENNSAYRTYIMEESTGDEGEDQDPIDIGVQEAQKTDSIEEDEEYIKVKEECKKLKEKLLQMYSDVFTESLKPGDKCNIPPVEIKIDEDVEVTSTNVKCPRDVYIQIQKRADKEIKELLAAGVIAESKNISCIAPAYCS